MERRQNKRKLCVHYGEGVVNIASDYKDWYAEYMPTSYTVRYKEAYYV